MYNYVKEVKNDVIDYLRENAQSMLDNNIDIQDENALNDYLFTEDAVTGNANGSYTFNSKQAREYIYDEGTFDNQNLMAVADAYWEYDDPNFMQDVRDGAWEKMDVTLRCYVLPEACGLAVDELQNEGFFDQFENEE